jgi:molybdate transport system regulatory protein
MVRLTVRVDLQSDAAFGPGKARLLELIGETGSIRRAAAAMDMSYRRAWLLLQETEEMMKEPIVAAKTGGTRGGGTSLTKFGQAVVESYRAIEAGAQRSAAAELRLLASMTKGDLTTGLDQARQKNGTTRKAPHH